MIPYGRQDISPADVDAVVAVLNSDFITQGPRAPEFEQALARKTGVDHAIAVNSATSALHVACAALDLGPGDLAWTSPITFVASANCARYCGADVDFVDIDPETLCMCPNALEAKLVDAAERGRTPKVVIPVHMCGQPCDMAAIGALARRFGFFVIEDAAHAIGAHDRGRPVGACVDSDVVAFSFHPVKIVTTAEGGAATTRDPTLAERMARLRSHGVTRDRAAMSRAPDGPWAYEQLELGYNYRMTELQAALGLSQLERLDRYVERRRELAERYDAALADAPVRMPKRRAEARSAHHLYVIRVPAERRKSTFERLRAAGIGVNVHYIPVHLQPYYRALGFARGAFPQAERYYDEAISLPLFPTMSEDQQDRVIVELREALR